jgi:hypothetical protein
MRSMASKLNPYMSGAVFAALLFVGGCALEVVPPAVPLQDTQAVAAPAEELLLDVAIRIFAPVQEPPIDGDTTLQNLRTAEGHYLSWQLGQTLQAAGQWGTIRLNPFMLNNADLMIDGSVVQSDGETLRVHVNAVDATGRRWLDRDYYQLADSASYAAPLGDTPPLPYRSLLNEVANDLLAFRERNFNAMSLATLRRVAALNFAAEFAPDLYGAYLVRDRAGYVMIDRMPAANDPVFAQIENIRNRNDLFLDAIQGQYTVYARRVDEPYRRFLARSQSITSAINGRLNAEDTEARYRSPIIGAPAESRSVEGTRIDIRNRRSDRLNQGADAARYAAALADAGSAFELDLTPQTLEFSQRTVTLTGSVEEQFAQWREILREMQALDTAP